MKKTSKKVVFFGNERLATGVTTPVSTLQSLIRAGYSIAAVVSNYERGTSRSTRELEIAQMAERFNIPLLLPGKLTDISSELQAYEAEIGILVAYGKIVPRSIIEIFPQGIINIHPSLLPRHRGPTPIESAILQGDKKTGVSIMRLVKAMDAGPVYGQSEFALGGDETKQELADVLLDIGSAMLMELLPGILSGQIIPLPQDDSRATYDSLLTKEDGWLDPRQKTATQLEREVRAFLKWPQSRIRLNEIEVIITSAGTLPLQGSPGHSEVLDKQLVVYCTNDALNIERLKPLGKREMTVQEFLAGYSEKL